MKKIFPLLSLKILYIPPPRKMKKCFLFFFSPLLKNNLPFPSKKDEEIFPLLSLKIVFLPPQRKMKKCFLSFFYPLIRNNLSFLSKKDEEIFPLILPFFHLIIRLVLRD
jgi:hypothetical protein